MVVKIMIMHHVGVLCGRWQAYNQQRIQALLLFRPTRPKPILKCITRALVTFYVSYVTTGQWYLSMSNLMSPAGRIKLFPNV
jgi:hypothetical protein